ncbi:ATP synthase F1 subunit delta [Lutimonas sp.]|uniref:ATP synthase F1 subunit delta n=1 Tax=Lutimonas sp. TaxID=1872403 RepID=UPI003D9AC848
MVGTRAALRYAKATLNLAKEKGFAKEVNDDMILIQSTIEENHDLEIMLKSPVIKSAAKTAVLKDIFGKKVNDITMGLINLLIENRRPALLELVAKEYIVIYDFLQGIEVAQVISAVPLTKDLEKAILKRVEEALGKQISLNNVVDPSIIGGFVLRVGDKLYDSSVSYRLNNLLSQFEDNHYISKI